MNEHPLAQEPSRARGAAIAQVACASSALGIALWLSPDARGFGTHEQLGLPPCSFREHFGVACPGCGLTTSVALAARGELRESFSAHAAGAPVALWFVWMLVVGLGRLFGWKQPTQRARSAIGALFAFAVVGSALLTWTARR